MDTARAPAPAERVRSALAGTDSLRLQAGRSSLLLDGGHGVLGDGTVVLSLPPTAAPPPSLAGAVALPVDARIDVTELSPTATRQRVRRKVRLSGRLRPLAWPPGRPGDAACMARLPRPLGWTTWSLTPRAVTLVEPAPRPLRSAGAARVSQEQAEQELDIRLGDYRSAVPDPLAAHERRHVTRLADRHPDAVDRLTALLDAADVVRSSRVLPVGLDSYGVTLRAEAPDGWVDVRLPFSQRACCPCAAWQLLASLVEHGVVAGAPTACEPVR